MLKKISSLLLIAMLILSCATTKIETTGKKNDTDEKGIINENFDPLILNDDDITIKKSKPVEAKSNYDDSIIKNIEETENPQHKVSGYRVQICALSNELAARDIQRDAIIKFTENVYLIFDSPYYKVRIGDCTTRFEADQLQRLAIEKGFEDAWVVKTKVKPKPKSELEEGSVTTP